MYRFKKYCGEWTIYQVQQDGSEILLSGLYRFGSLRSAKIRLNKKNLISNIVK